MIDKNLTESAWKTFAKGASYKDASFLKALAGLEKADRDGPEAQLNALDDIEKQIKVLRSAYKGDKELAAQLDKVEKAADALRKTADKALKEAEVNDEEEEDSPALLTTKLLPLVKQVRKGDVVMKAMIVTAGKDAAVLLAKRAISPARSKLLKEYLGASGGAKVIVGECLLEANALTFVVQSQAAGLAKKLKAALHAQIALKLKVRVRGEDPDDLDEEGDEDADEGIDAAGAAEPPTVDPVQQQFDTRLAGLEPLIAAALRVQRGDTTKIRAVADFAREKGNNGNPTAGLKALETLEQLLRAAANAPPPSGGEAQGQTVEPGAAFNARLTALMPKVKEAIAAAGPSANDIKLKISEAGVLARKREFDPAHALLDAAEQLLAPPSNPSPEATRAVPDSPTRTNTAYTQSRLAWDETRKKIQSELRKLELAILDACKEEEDFNDIAEGTKGLYEILEYLDTRLIDKLDEALNASDPDVRKELNNEAREIVDEYLDFVKADELLQDIDGNGFVDVAIQSTLNATLGVLSRKLAELNR